MLTSTVAVRGDFAPTPPTLFSNDTNRKRKDAELEAARATVARIYASSVDARHRSYAQRMSNCSDGFRCKVASCTVCTFKTALFNRARTFKALDHEWTKHPRDQLLSVTLSVRNPEIGELRTTIQGMNKALTRLVPALNSKGWVRSLEVTPSEENEAHPHFHALMLFKQRTALPTTAELQHVWAESAKLDYLPNVWAAPVAEYWAQPPTSNSHVVTAVRYTFKAADPALYADPDYFLVYSDQLHDLHGRHSLCGGVLQGIFN